MLGSRSIHLRAGPSRKLSSIRNPNTGNSKTTPIYASSVPSTNPNTHLHNTPCLTSIAFRGTLIKGNAFSRDLELDIHIIKNGLHLTSRFDIAMQAV
ncbi:hypothetical protein Hdeb2414_s0013g00420151 [Helianthus debilis subsp. tardiflorus]